MPCFCPVDNVGVVECPGRGGRAGRRCSSTASDAVSTLVTTRRRRGRHWPTQVFYRRTWRAWVAAARRAGPELREGFLAVYGPLSLLGLLVTWVVLLVAGWGAVWWGLRSAVDRASTATSTRSTSPASGSSPSASATWCPPARLARLLVVVEAFMGLVTMALVIGYLPTLYGAYSRREVQLLSLDDMSDEATTPIGFLEACYTQRAAPRRWRRAFADWERWCDEVFDSHTAYPMLALFRSRQPGQNWLTGLGVVLDAATITPGRGRQPPRWGRRRGCGGGPRGCCRASWGCPRSRRRADHAWTARRPTRPTFREAYQTPGRARGAAAPLRAGLGRLRAGCAPPTCPGWSRPPTLLQVPLEFRHQTARLDITRSG